MLSTTGIPFNQDIFFEKYENWLGKDTLNANKKYGGLCQALCIIIALQGHEHPLVDILLTSGSTIISPGDVSSKNDLSESKKFSLLEAKFSHTQQLLRLLEEVAINAHPLEVLSRLNLLYRVTFDKLSLSSETYENKKDLLIFHDNQYKINSNMLSSLLEKYEDNRYIQISFIEKEGRSITGGHTTLLFKSKNIFYFFDPSRILFSSQEFSKICSEIDISLNKLYENKPSTNINGININLNKTDKNKPISINIIDLKSYLELHKGLDWVKKIQNITSTETFPTFSKEEKQNIKSLHSAIDKGCSLFAKILLDEKADINLIVNNLTPLEHAIKKADFLMIKLLLEYGAEVKNTTLNTISDPEIKSFIILRLLVRHINDFQNYFDFDTANKYKQYIAQQSLNIKPVWTTILKNIMDSSFENKKSDSYSNLFWTFLKKMGNNSAENKTMHSKNDLHEKYFSSETILQNTLLQCEEKMTKALSMEKMLLEHKMIVNGSLQSDALLCAIEMGKGDIIKEVARRWDKTMANEFSTAAMNSQYEVVKILSEYANKSNLLISYCTDYYEIVLKMLAIKGDAQMIQTLFEYLSEDTIQLMNISSVFYSLFECLGNEKLIDVSGKYYSTDENNHFNTVKVFCEKAEKIRLDINKQYRDSGRALHLAANNPKSSNIIQLLCTMKANVNAINNAYGNTPLGSAIERGLYENVKALLDSKANVNLLFNNFNRESVTPLEYAITIKEPHLKIIKLLLNHGAEIKNVFNTIPSPPEIKSFITLQLLAQYIKNYPWQRECPNLAEKQLAYITEQPLDEKSDWTTILENVMVMSQDKMKKTSLIYQFGYFSSIDENQDQLTTYLAHFSSIEALENAICHSYTSNRLKT